jgi:hypothetical protein
MEGGDVGDGDGGVEAFDGAVGQSDGRHGGTPESKKVRVSRTFSSRRDDRVRARFG